MSPDASSIAVAVSGGVDSLCALYLLKNAGLAPVAVHGIFFDPDPASHERIRAVCNALQVPVSFIDLRQIFEKLVIGPFIKAYLSGYTPNPCVLCNKRIKFGALLGACARLGLTRIATGHYARLAPNPWGETPLVARGKDASRDQSYFLALLGGAQTARLVFPLGKLTKKECREIVAKAGLDIPEKKESRDICFVREKGYADFMARRLPALSQSGPVLLHESRSEPRQIGEHRGLWRYTEGQRKGLGIPWSEPLYVREKDVRNSALVLAPRELAMMKTVIAKNMIAHVPPALWPDELYVQPRLSLKARVLEIKFDNDRLKIIFQEPVLPAAPGQLAAIYDKEGRVLAGAILEQVVYE